MGAPVQAFVRLSDKPIRTRAVIEEPDYLIVQDPTLFGLVDVFHGIKDGGTVMVNTEKPDEIDAPDGVDLKAVAGTKIAMDVIGRPIPNMVMVGAFAGMTGLVSLESIQAAVKERFPGKVGDLNAEAVAKAYNEAKGEE